jgi:hypothetical protein
MSKEYSDPSLKEKYKKERKEEKIEGAATAAAISAAVAAALPASIQVHNTQTKEFDSDLYITLNEDKDKPLNQDTFVVAHNVGTGSGDTLPGLGNQQMTTTESLTLTGQVNGGMAYITYPIAVDDDGEWVVNHGGISVGSEPLTLESQLNDVSEWQDQNPGSIAIIAIGNQGGAINEDNSTPEQHAEFDAMIKEKYGDSLFTNSDLVAYKEESETTDMPSQQWLNDHGYDTIIVTSGMNNYKNGAIDKTHFQQDDYTNAQYEKDPRYIQGHGESRAPLLYFIRGFSGEPLPILNTEESDHRLSQPGRVGFDNLQPNDPRLVDPNKRDELTDDPDMSIFGGMLQMNRGTESIAAFSAGLSISSASASFAIMSALYKAHLNFDFIKNIDKNIATKIATIDRADLEVFKKKNKRFKNYKDEELIEAFCRTDASQKITRDTMLAGVTGTASLSASTFSAGLMFPVAFPITSLVSLGIAGVGMVATTAATTYNRYKLNKRIDQAITQNKDLIKQRIEILNSQDNDFDIEKAMKEKERDSSLDKTSNSLLTTTLFFKATAMAKYSISMIGVMAAGVSSVFIGISSVVDLTKEARKRSKNFENVTKYTSALLVNNIFAKKFLVFGDSTLDKYAKKNCKLNGQKVGTYLNNLDDKEFTKLSVACANNRLKKDVNKFLKSKKIKDKDKGLDLFMKSKVSKDVFRSTVVSSSIATVKIAAAISSFGLIMFPPASGFYLMAATAVITIGTPINLIHAKFQERKFAKKLDILLDAKENPKLKLTEAEKAERATMQELKQNLNRLINEETPHAPDATPKKKESAIVTLPPQIEEVKKKDSLVKAPRIPNELPVRNTKTLDKAPPYSPDVTLKKKEPQLVDLPKVKNEIPTQNPQTTNKENAQRIINLPHIKGPQLKAEATRDLRFSHIKKPIEQRTM